MNKIENDINNEINLNNNSNYIQVEQEKFFQTNIGKIINTTVNAGLRYILPDILEDELIKIKDSILENGFKEGLNTAITEGINFGKSTVGIFTGRFENVQQMQNAIKNGGIIDNISKLIDYSVNVAQKKGKLNNNTSNIIKRSKNVLLNNISSNIESMIENQVNLVKKLDSNINEWKVFYNNKDFNGMEKIYKKIKDIQREIMPLEKIINEGREIENLHSIIKNNGHNFELSESEKNLAKIL